MQSGKLRHRIAIQSPTETADDAGGIVQAWAAITDGASVPASIDPLTGREAYRAQQITAQVDVKFTVRYLPSVTPKCRVVWDSRNFNIIWIENPEQKNRELHLFCRESPA